MPILTIRTSITDTATTRDERPRQEGGCAFATIAVVCVGPADAPGQQSIDVWSTPLQAYRLAAAVQFDGRLDEPVWDTADSFSSSASANWARISVLDGGNLLV